MTPSSCLVRLDDVLFEYPGGPGAPVLGPFTLALGAGEFVGVTGPSGAGKSTLLGLIGGLLQPTAGVRTSRGSVASAYVLQTHAVHPYLRVWENVATAWGLPRRAMWARAERVLAAFDLGALADRRGYELSGGQRQRLAVARAVASRADVIVADEPTGSLDAVNTARVLDALEAATRRGRAVVVATHDDHVRLRCHRVVELTPGGTA
ncbi:ATP-binding cassette domain-containing protein [Microbacterium sp. PA5]|uniref:ATP-binding cassette domain-containing protein n=1 Tax=Microbacterium sp. PA5 TaxID=3416654 RepID=UPI003CF1B368